MKLPVKNMAGQDQGELEVRFQLVENGKGTQAVHDAVVAFMAAQRSGTACTKTMGEVAGSGKKPWRQKGTGRARAGSLRSPLWRGGGVTFGPKPRDFRKKISKSTRQLALRKAVSERIKSNEVTIVDQFELKAPKTREICGVLRELGLKGSILLVTHAPDQNLALAARNVQKVDITSGGDLNTYQVLRYDHLVFTRDGFEQLEKRLQRTEMSAETAAA